MDQIIRKKPVVFGLLALITLFSLVFVLLSGYRLPDYDERAYYDLAAQLMRTGAYSNPHGKPTAYWPPGYPIFLYFIIYLYYDVLFLKIIGVAPLLATAVACYRLASRHSDLAGLLSLVTIACYPLFFYTSSKLFPQTVGSLLFVLTVALISGRPRPTSRVILASLIYGLLILTIPAFLMLTVILLPGVYLMGDGGVGERIRSAALFVGGVVLVLSPWTIRNYEVFHTFIPISTNSGFNLIVGNSENTTYNSSSDIDIYKYKNMAEGLGEVESDRYLRRSAIEWFFGNPKQSIPLYFSKVLNYFNFKNKLATKEEQSSLKELVLFLTYYPLLLLTLVRLCFREKYPLSKLEIFIYVVYFSNSLISAIFMTRIRYRVPFDYLLVVVASNGAACLFDSARERMAQRVSFASHHGQAHEGNGCGCDGR